MPEGFPHRVISSSTLLPGTILRKDTRPGSKSVETSGLQRVRTALAFSLFPRDFATMARLIAIALESHGKPSDTRSPGSSRPAFSANRSNKSSALA
jgi:hypothetical protein